MAITNFIPQVWSARLQENLKQALVFGNLCNHNYEGDISQWGDTVHINMLNDITVKPYTPGMDIADPEQLSGSDITLTIDHGAYYNFFINDVDAAQARADLMDEAMKNAAYRLAVDAEKYILQVIKDGAGNNAEITLEENTPAALYNILLRIKGDMDAAGVSRFGRKLVISPVIEMLLLSDERFICGSSEANARLEDGKVARALGFDIYVSHDLMTEIIAMIPEAVTFANQITKVDAYRPEKGFCDGVKGLCLSGAKVLIPDAVQVYTLTE